MSKSYCQAQPQLKFQLSSAGLYSWFFPPPIHLGKYQNCLIQPELLKQSMLGQWGDLKSSSDKFQHGDKFSSGRQISYAKLFFITLSYYQHHCDGFLLTYLVFVTVMNFHHSDEFSSPRWTRLGCLLLCHSHIELRLRLRSSWGWYCGWGWSEFDIRFSRSLVEIELRLR